MNEFYTVEFYVNGAIAAYPARFTAIHLAYDVQDELRDSGQSDACVIAYPASY